MLLQALESKVLLDTAMSLYGLKHSELYWEKAQVILLPDRMSRRFLLTAGPCMVFAHMLYTSETLFHEGICGDVQDTKLLVSWNDDTIVIAFRGTSSMANALADLQVAYPLPTSLLCLLVYV